MSNLNKIILVRINTKITVFIPFYDFIVKFKILDLVDLYTPNWKGDESQIDSEGLKISIEGALIASE